MDCFFYFYTFYIFRGDVVNIQETNDNRRNNDVQNTTQKTKDRGTRTLLKSGI
jgi:hypothetical protein